MEDELGKELIKKLTKKDWHDLHDKCMKEDCQWRWDLLSVISPLNGVVAQNIIMDIALSKEKCISAYALDIICYYCGISSDFIMNSEPPSEDWCVPNDAIIIPDPHGYGCYFVHMDETIQHVKFMRRLRKHKNFISMIPDIARSILNDDYGDKMNDSYVKYILLQKVLIDDPAQAPPKKPKHDRHKTIPQGRQAD